MKVHRPQLPFNTTPLGQAAGRTQPRNPGSWRARMVARKFGIDSGLASAWMEANGYGHLER